MGSSVHQASCAQELLEILQDLSDSGSYTCGDPDAADSLSVFPIYLLEYLLFYRFKASR